ncbi:Phage terminase-like protein, large subunit, contains N-terminal HTH domain [Azospirillum oryzae]|uniref:Phage terminase-like protein, large subunit, contains N-terminal HTH domain n=1 Tax=Azospirillum oryzae TaxID=286727 RepID=A0A1X7HCP1_9PROT|nr:terminase large subunit [Azospirillum oryzae]SMF83266.1 Phage terminase-like protein, large subunit, contains N-terminal HTH domain [Azospirillum oryzae]
MTAWNTACLDWEDRILSGRSLVPDLPLNQEEAAKAIRIFNRLRLPDVIGTPLLADATGDWFRDIVAALFGSYDPVTHRRAIQEVFLLVPKKNGKSTNAAAVMVTAAIINRRPEAELLLVAPTKEIADISFRQAAGMIRADEALKKLFHPQRHIRTITHRISGAAIKIVAADTDAVTGAKATFILIDETHVFASKSRAADVFVELRGALAARPDGFLFQISTQSKTTPAGVFKSELGTARRVRDGEQSLPLLPVIYELPARVAEGKGWTRSENMGLVNPNLGRSVNTDFLVRELGKAEREGPDALALFASQHLNVEIGLNLRSDRWAGADHWEARGDKSLTLEAILERSDVVVAGIDGGGLDDLLGLAILGRDKLTREWLLWAHAWAHRGVLTRRKEEAPRLLDFEKGGDLTIVDNLPDDVTQLVDIIAKVDASGLLATVGLDPMGVGAIVDALAERKIGGEEDSSGKDRVIGVSQGWKLTGAIKTAERKLVDGTLAHAGQPLMAWCVGNAKVEPRGNAVVITKQAAGAGKIDALMAAFDAVALMSTNPEAQGPSVYTTRGLLIM